MGTKAAFARLARNTRKMASAKRNPESSAVLHSRCVELNRIKQKEDEEKKQRERQAVEERLKKKKEKEEIENQERPKYVELGKQYAILMKKKEKGDNKLEKKRSKLIDFFRDDVVGSEKYLTDQMIIEENEKWKNMRSKMNRDVAAGWEKNDEELEQLSMLKYVPKSKKKGILKTPHYRGRYFTTRGSNESLITREENIQCEWVETNFVEKYIKILYYNPDTYFVVPVGCCNMKTCPSKLSVNYVIVKYPQKDKPTCLYRGLASALYYLQFKNEAHQLAHQQIALEAEGMPLNMSVKILYEKLENILPSIGRVLKANHLSTNRKWTIELNDLFSDLSKYPTVILPLGSDGSINHAVCVVDDLIFDSTQSVAMKLCQESLDWICGNKCIGIYGAFRLGLTAKKGAKPGQKFLD